MSAGATDDPVVAGMVRRVLEGYRSCGPLAFAYGQGSTFTGFETRADLDIVLVWPEHSFAPERRPARSLCDPDVEPVQYDGSGYGMDNLVIDGRDVQVINFARPGFDHWCRLVEGGEGWHEDVWPCPLHVVAGFVYGLMLEDASGEGEAIRARLSAPPVALQASSRRTVAAALPQYRKDLTSAAERGESWLFHTLATRLLKQAYVTWFAAEGYYLPFPKHLDRWIQRFGLDRELAEREPRIWRLPSLPLRRDAVLEFVERVVALGR